MRNDQPRRHEGLPNQRGGRRPTRMIGQEHRESRSRPESETVISGVGQNSANVAVGAHAVHSIGHRRAGTLLVMEGWEDEHQDESRR